MILWLTFTRLDDVLASGMLAKVYSCALQRHSEGAGKVAPTLYIQKQHPLFSSLTGLLNHCTMTSLVLLSLLVHLLHCCSKMLCLRKRTDHHFRRVLVPQNDHKGSVLQQCALLHSLHSRTAEYNTFLIQNAPHT